MALVALAAFSVSPIAAASDAAGGTTSAPSAAVLGAQEAKQHSPQGTGTRVLRRALRATEAIIKALSPWASVPSHSPDERPRSEIFAATQSLVRAEAALRTYVSQSSGKRSGEQSPGDPTTGDTIVALQIAAQRVGESVRAVLEVRRTLVFGATDHDTFVEALERTRAAETAVRMALAMMSPSQEAAPD